MWHSLQIVVIVVPNAELVVNPEIRFPGQEM